MNENWLCLQTYAGQEMKLAKALNSLSIPAYTPCFQRKVKRFFTEVVTDIALFKTYLFASPEYHLRKSAVQLLPTKIKSFVAGDVDFELVEEIRAREVNGYIQLSKQEAKVVKTGKYQRGDSVIYSGIGNFEAVFDSYTTDDERVIILATMFNQKKLMPVSIYDLAMAV